ncbi:MAG: helix-turn-helix domain-containing GNAT family N-acetyltransferase [Oceanospirillaceae bacterium]
MAKIDADIEKVRSFNRFHTLLVGALNEGMLDSDFPLAQARIIFELAQSNDVAAADLAQTLSVDRGYLSRMIAVLNQRGLLNKTPDLKNKKRIVLSLSTQGEAVFADLNQASVHEIRELIAPLSEKEREVLVESMQKISQLLSGQSKELQYKAQNYQLRAPKPGDLAWIAQRHAKLYWDEYQLDWTFEALVCGIVKDFVDNFDAQAERCWVAEMNEKIVGSVFIVRHDETTAKLRLLYVEEDARGLGLGRKLVEQSIQFARQKGYQKLVLWTNSVLTTALHIYEAQGFKLIEEEPYHSFGQDLIGQNWELIL